MTAAPLGYHADARAAVPDPETAKLAGKIVVPLRLVQG